MQETQSNNKYITLDITTQQLEGSEQAQQRESRTKKKLQLNKQSNLHNIFFWQQDNTSFEIRQFLQQQIRADFTMKILICLTMVLKFTFVMVLVTAGQQKKCYYHFGNFAQWGVNISVIIISIGCFMFPQLFLQYFTSMYFVEDFIFYFLDPWQQIFVSQSHMNLEQDLCSRQKESPLSLFWLWLLIHLRLYTDYHIEVQCIHFTLAQFVYLFRHWQLCQFQLEYIQTMLFQYFYALSSQLEMVLFDFGNTNDY
ncbi:unnamed protein product [Paramecium pentaurelia]|uniref:Transmembrane protein n=1 Tax=Paramecium pentaurelia TaxID=43138 RepID=A0A8S1YKD7_9CILI|nr:unnamed protein product [Paramecium pentaurelia]